MSINIVWFRLDLRLTDNPALQAATANGARVMPLYIWNPEEEGNWSPGAASRFWLHQSLEQLDQELQKFGARLIIRKGDSITVLKSISKDTNAGAVFWNKRYEPSAVKQDAAVQAALRSSNVIVKTFNSSLLYEPSQIHNQSGKPFQVFTPFWNRCNSIGEPANPIGKPKIIDLPRRQIDSLPLADLGLQSKINWPSGARNCWTPGEYGANVRLKQFVNNTLERYARGRDYPSEEGVSMLSPHLHFGELSARQVFHAVQEARKNVAQKENIDKYLTELGWRDFAHYILFHFPKTADHPLREQFEHFAWAKRPDHLKRWQEGTTGYPIVDAGMRQLRHTGWMHNRVRMIVASFLTKDLLISWTEGARWFWDTLVDADLANNTLGWQWAAGCGADAAPYFRIFNPVLQAEKFDPDGQYVKAWLPELNCLSAQYIHKPWMAAPAELKALGIRLGLTYPKPIVDHRLARQRALAALSEINKEKHRQEIL